MQCRITTMQYAALKALQAKFPLPGDQLFLQDVLDRGLFHSQRHAPTPALREQVKTILGLRGKAGK